MVKNLGKTIISEDVVVSNNSFETNLNNNILVVGPSGSGKTRGYVIPNITFVEEESLVVTDTKGELYRTMAPVLAQKGYKTYLLDFTGNYESTIGYNILDGIMDCISENYDQQAILRLSSILVPLNENDHDPFWHHAARSYCNFLLGYIFECLPEEEHNLSSLEKLFSLLLSGEFEKMIKKLEILEPECFPVKQYKVHAISKQADRTHASITCILGTYLQTLFRDEIMKLSEQKHRLGDFQFLRHEKIALFVNISDSDRSNDLLLSIFYSQLFHHLCNHPSNNSKKNFYPVRIIMDDFAAGAVIPDFTKIISVTRSRSIDCSIIIQDISQLESLYKKSGSRTIMNNCDRILYLGGNDLDTCFEFSRRLNRPLNEVLYMDINDAWYFERGTLPKKVQKYQLEKHREELFSVLDTSGTEKKENGSGCRDMGRDRDMEVDIF